MAGDHIYIRWLEIGDAPAVAALERRFHPDGPRAGALELVKDVWSAEEHLSNLWLGLFDAGRMVGYLLASLEVDRHDIFEYFEVSVPEGAESGRCIFVADIGVLPDYKRHLGSMIRQLMAVALETHHGVTLEAFAIGPLGAHWSAKAKAITRFGYRLTRITPVDQSQPGVDQHWLTYQPIPGKAERPARYRRSTLADVRAISVGAKTYEVGIVETSHGLRALGPAWDALARAQRVRSPLSAAEYCKAWRLHKGLDARLHLVVARDGDRIVGIAPLQLRSCRRLGSWFRQLELMGSIDYPDRPPVLADPSDPGVETALAERVVQDDNWQVLRLTHQRPNSRFSAGLSAAAHAGQRSSLQRPAHSRPGRIASDRPWQALLATCSPQLRKRLQTAQAGLGARVMAGPPHEGEDAEPALDRWLEVEAQSDVRCLTGTTATFDLYRRLARYHSDDQQARIRFLLLRDRPIAAAFGIRSAGELHLLKVVSDASYRRHAPGLLLVAAELEAACDDAGVHAVWHPRRDFPVGEGPEWPTTMEDAETLVLDRRAPWAHPRSFTRLLARTFTQRGPRSRR
ncbi:MAG: GNAT family N-acetyltransferase [Myxococcales bacterium]|nr:GNAT family N-acetyltransferase [Myxococcales bacterium]